MELALFFILALVAGSQAGPIQDRTDQCAQQCTVSRQFNYEEGKVYNFLYENNIRTAIEGASEDHAGLQLNAHVALTFVTKCEAVMQLSDVQLADYDPETSSMKATISDLADRLTRHPVRVSFQDGKIEHVCLTDSSEEPEIVNIKKGILSVIQNSMNDISKPQNVGETDITGECEAEYTSSDKGWYNVLVKKSKNLLGCTGRNSAQTSIQGIPYTSQSKIQSVPLVKSTHSCEQELVKSSGRLVSAMCEEKHVFAPFSRQESGAVTNSKQTLTFRNEARARVDLGPVHSRVPLTFDHDKKSMTTSIAELQRKMKEICQSTSNGMTIESPALFKSLVYTMKTMDAPAMINVFQNIKKPEFCAGNGDRVKKFFLDAIPMTGTSASLRLMTQMIIGKEITGIEADMWLTSLSFMQNPTVDMLAEVKSLLTMDTNIEKAMLSVSSLVNSLCKNNPSCDNYLAVKKIISILESKIASGCIVKDTNMKTTLIAIRAIGNAGFGTSAIPTMIKCFSRSKNPVEIRLSAIEAFRRMPCKVDRSSLLSTLKNMDEDSEIRIAAYKSLMVCPSDYLLRQVKGVLSKEEVNQVGSYIWSHLTNLMETADPHKQAIKSILDDSILQKEFDMDKRKFSRNYEGSLFIEKINTGATVEADAIWSSKSFIPRSGMLNLTVDLFGNAVNLFEVGGRVEGLEYFLESYFGPNGYFSEKDVQNAADETALAPVRTDKVNRINNRMVKVMDELRGNLYLRVFGNELRYMNFKGMDSLSAEAFNIFDVMMKLSKDNKYQFTQSTMFLDSNFVIPTSAGFPLTMSVNGTATIDLQASGKLDVMKLASKPASLDINGIIKPSGSVEIASLMTVDAIASKIGVKMVSTLHSSTSVQGKVTLSEGTILDAEIDIPEKKMDIIRVKSSFFTVHRESEREQKMITSNKRSQKICTGEVLAKVSGLEFCGDLEYPNASLVTDAPYFPITGPVRIGLYMNKKDSLTGYRLKARSIHNKDENIIHLSFSTPNSKINRNFGIDLNLNKEAGTVDSSITSPWTKGDFKGSYTNNKKLKSISGALNWDGSLRYEVNAKLTSEKSGPGMLYTPSVSLKAAGRTPIELKGSIKAAAWKILDVDMQFSGLKKSPIIVKTTLLNKGQLIRAKASLQLEPKKEYLFDTSMQTIKLKKKVSYRPQISIRTPTKEIFAFGGSLDQIHGRGLQYNLVLDKVASKPLILKGVVAMRQYRRGRVLYNVKVDLKTPLVESFMRTKLDNRNFKTVATDIDLKYVIKKFARDSVKIVTKVNNLSSKSLTKVKGSVIFTSKKNPTTNFKLLGNLNHNKKHSEVDAALSYGSNPKDTDKQMSVSASLDRDMKSLTAASVAFVGEYKKGSDLRLFSRIRHSHTPKSLLSNVVLRKNKDAITADVDVKDESKDMKKLSGKVDMYILGKSISLSQSIEETQPHAFTSKLQASIGKAKHSIVTSWHTTDGETVMKSNVGISGYEPFVIEADYKLGPNMYKVAGSMQKGKTVYSVATTSQLNAGQSIETTVDITLPTRHIISSIEGTRSDNKYNIRADTRWNADRDDTQRLTVRGSGQMSGLQNIDGSLTIQYPSRTIALNIKQNTIGKYVSRVSFQWEPNKQISVDTSFGSYVKKGNQEVQATFKLATPFSMLKKVDLNVNHVSESGLYRTNVDVEWNPKQIISTTFTLKRPASFDLFDAEFIGKTPFTGLKTFKVSHSHNGMKGPLASLTKVAWNKQYIQMDLSLTNKGNERKTDVLAEVNIKTSFRKVKTVSSRLSYFLNGKKMMSKGTIKLNKFDYTIDSSINHEGFDWKSNSGKVVLSTPSSNIKTAWNHHMTVKDITSSTEIIWGNNRRVFIKYNGLNDFAAHAVDLTSSLEIQTPFANCKDITFQLKHQHRHALIDSSMSLMKDGSKIASAEGKYLRKNGNVNSHFTFTNPIRDGEVSVKLNSNYLQTPFSLDLDVALSPVHSMSLSSSYIMGQSGNVDGSIALQSSLMNPVKVSMTRNINPDDISAVLSIEYSNGKVVKVDSKYSLGSNKFVKVTFSSPFTQIYSGDVSMTSTKSVTTVTGAIEALPLIPRWSAEARVDMSSGISGKVRIDTPLKMVPYSQVTFSSGSRLRSNQVDITAEYVPGKIISSFTRYNMDDIKSINFMSTLSTPFESLPHVSLSFNHQGPLSDMHITTDFEYSKGKHILIENDLSTLNGMKGSLSIKSPFASEMKGAFGLTKDQQTVKASMELVFGKRLFAQLVHSGQSDDFSSDLNVEVDNEKWNARLSFEANPIVKTSFSLQTPMIRFRSIKAMHSFEGNLVRFNTKLDVSTSEFGSFSLNSNFDRTNAISANLAVTTPFRGYRKLNGIFTHDGKLQRFQTHAEVSVGPSKVAGDIKLVTDPSVNLEVSLQTPLPAYKLTTFSLNHEGDSSRCKTNIKVQKNKKTSQILLNYNNVKKLDIDLTIRHLNNDPIKATLDLSGSLKRFTKRIQVSIGKDKYNADVRFQLRPFTTLIDIRTPVQWLKRQRLNIKHSGSRQAFQCNFNYNCNGKKYDGDVSFESEDSFKGAVNLDGPKMPKLAGRFTHEGSVSNFNSEMEISYGKKIMKATGQANTLNGIDVSLRIETPFTGIESLRGSLTHSGTTENFKSVVELSNGKKAIRATSEVNILNGIQGHIEIQTPFQGLKSLKGSIAHEGSVRNFKSGIELSCERDRIKATGELNTLNGVRGLFNIDTPYSENLKASVSHSGSFRNFNSEMELSTGRKTINAKGALNTLDGVRGNLEIRTPFMDIVQGSLKHSGNIKKFNTETELSYGSKTVKAVGNLNAYNGLRVNAALETPFEGLESMKCTLTHSSTPLSLRTIGDISIDNRRGLIDLNVDATNGVSANLQVSTPFSQVSTLTASLNHKGNLNNFNTETTLGLNGDSITSKINFENDATVSGAVSLTSSARSFGNYEASFRHDGSIRRFMSHGDVSINSQRSEVDVSFDGQEGYASIKSPLTRHRELGFKYIPASTSVKTNVYTNVNGQEMYKVIAEVSSDRELNCLLSVETPIKGYEVTQFTFTLERAIQNFQTQAALSFRGKSHSIEISLISDGQMQGKFNMKSPSMNDIESSFLYNGHITNFRSSFETLIDGRNMLRTDIIFNIEGRINAELKIASPLFRNVKITLIHNKSNNDIESRAFVNLGGDIARGEMYLKIRPSMVGSLSIESPFTKDLKVDMEHSGPISNCKSSLVVNYGGQSQIDMKSDLNTQQNIEGNINIQSRIPGLKMMSASFNHGNSRSGTSSSCEITINDKAASIDSKTSAGQASFLLKSPYADDVKVSYDTNGEFPKGSAKAEASYGVKSILKVDGSMVSLTDGELTIKTPLQGYEETTLKLHHVPKRNIINSDGEIMIFGAKHSFALSLDRETARVSFDSPLLKPIKIVARRTGNLVNFDTHGEVSYGQAKYEMDVALNVESKKEGKMTIKSPENFGEVSANILGNVKQFNGLGKIDVNGMVHSVDISFDSIGKLDGSISLKSPLVPMVDGSFSVVGNLQDFLSKAEVTVNTERHEIEASLKTGDDFIATFSLASPLTVPVRVELQNDGESKNFESSAKLTIGADLYRTDAKFNIQTAKEASISISMPNSAPVKVSMSKSDDNIVLAATQGKSVFYTLRTGLKLNPLKGSISLDSSVPGYERIAAGFTHEERDLDFKSHVEVEIGQDKSEADVHFNAGSKFEGGLSVKSPYMEPIQSGFEYKGNYEKLSYHLDASYGSQEYAVDASVDTTTKLDADISITSPLKGYKSIKGQLSSSGVFPNIDSSLNIKTGRRVLLSTGAKASTSMGSSARLFVSSALTPTIEFNAEYKGTIQQFSGNMELKYNGQSSNTDVMFKGLPDPELSLFVSSPLIERRLSTSMSYKNQVDSITAHAEGAIGAQKYETDISVFYGNGISTTVSANTPIRGYESMKATGKHILRTQGFKNSMSFEKNTDKIVFESQGSWAGPVSGSMELRTPFYAFEKISANGQFAGSIPNVKYELHVSTGHEDYSVVAELEHLATTNGRITITTPIPGYEDIGASIYKKGPLSNVDIQASVNYATGRAISFELKNNLGHQSLETEANFRSPYTEDASMRFSYRGIPTDFSNTLVFGMGQENTVTSVTSFKLARSSMNLNSRLSSELAGSKDEQRISLTYNGDLPNFQASGSARILGNDYSLDSSLSTSQLLKGSVSIRTPFSAFKDIAASVDLNKRGGRYTANTELQVDTGKKLVASAEFLKYGWRRLQSSMTVETPFIGLERSSLSYRHTASVDSFECDGEMNLFEENYKGKVTGSYSPLSISVSANTPFHGLEQINVGASADYSKYGLKGEVNMDVSSENIISAKTEMDLSANPKSASISLSTPFKGYETTELSFILSGDIRDFQSEFKAVTPFNAPLEASANMKYNTPSDMSASATFRSKISGLEELQLTASNSFSYNTYNSRVGASWAPYKSIVLQSALKDSSKAMNADISLTTPFELIRELSINAGTVLSRKEYTSTFASTYNRRKYSDIEVKVDLGNRKKTVVTMRAPIPLLVDLSGTKLGEVYEGAAIISRDVEQKTNAFTLDGKIDVVRKTISLRHKCSMMEFTLDGIFSKQYSNVDFTLNNVRYGYNMKLSNTEGNVKVILPSRSVQVSGSLAGRTSEASVMWDADRDESKKIAVRSVITPSKDSMKADISLTLPDKDTKLNSEVVVNRGRILFDGKTELTYSKDISKKFTIVSRVEDVSFERSAKNYSFVFGISHPFSNVDMKISSHLGKTNNRFSGAVDMEYQQKKVSVHGEVDKLRNTASFDMVSPLKKISISGTATEQPFRVSVSNSYDNKSPLRTTFSVDTRRRSISLETNYDRANPNNELHVSARYVNSSAVAAEVYHTVDRQRITDLLITSRLNNSRLLHSRLHWRPSLVNDIMDLVDRENLDMSTLKALKEKMVALHGQASNMTRHPSLVFLRNKYDQYLNYMKQNPSYGMADRYTSAMYGAREMINPVLLQQGENAYKYWEVKENTNTLVNVIKEWIKEEIENELSGMQVTLFNLAKTKVTVFDPEHGEIQTEVHLPFPMKSLDTLPTVDITPFINKAKQYIPETPHISLPSADISNLLPPFRGVAKLEGNTITTFDGRTYELTDSCTQVLARDYVDGNFSLVLNKIDNNNKSLLVFVDGISVEILPNGQVKVNDKTVNGSLQVNDVMITSLDTEIVVDGAGSFKVTYSPIEDVYTFTLNGWYFGKTAGLLGTFDNEPSNDLLSSFGKPIEKVDRFTKTWDVGTSRCR